MPAAVQPTAEKVRRLARYEDIVPAGHSNRGLLAENRDILHQNDQMH